jgi:hypothetical protein
VILDPLHPKLEIFSGTIIFFDNKTVSLERNLQGSVNACTSFLLLLYIKVHNNNFSKVLK